MHVVVRLARCLAVTQSPKNLMNARCPLGASKCDPEPGRQRSGKSEGCCRKSGEAAGMISATRTCALLRFSWRASAAWPSSGGGKCDLGRRRRGTLSCCCGSRNPCQRTADGFPLLQASTVTYPAASRRPGGCRGGSKCREVSHAGRRPRTISAPFCLGPCGFCQHTLSQTCS